MGEVFSKEAAEARNPEKIVMAHWVALKTDNVRVKISDIALFFFGIWSYTSRQTCFEYVTYHPVDRFSSANLRIKIWFGIGIEAGALFLGIGAIAAMVSAIVMFFMGKNGGPAVWKIGIMGGGILGILLSRFLLKYALSYKVPVEVRKDASSPFYLNSVKIMER